MVAPCCICPGSSRAAPQTCTNQKWVLSSGPIRDEYYGHVTSSPPIPAHLTALIAFSRCGSCSSCPESRKPLSYLDMEKIFNGAKKYFLRVNKNCCWQLTCMSCMSCRCCTWPRSCPGWTGPAAGPGSAGAGGWRWAPSLCRPGGPACTEGWLQLLWLW